MAFPQLSTSINRLSLGCNTTDSSTGELPKLDNPSHASATAALKAIPRLDI
jgi:hypothetical protein